MGRFFLTTSLASDVVDKVAFSRYAFSPSLGRGRQRRSVGLSQSAIIFAVCLVLIIFAVGAGYVIIHLYDVAFVETGSDKGRITRRTPSPPGNPPRKLYVSVSVGRGYTYEHLVSYAKWKQFPKGASVTVSYRVGRVSNYKITDISLA